MIDCQSLSNHALRQRVINPPNISSLLLGNSAFLIGQAHPERCDSSLTLKGSRTGPSFSSAKSTDCCPCGWTHGEPEQVRVRSLCSLCIFISRLPQGKQAPFYTQPCAYLGERTLSTTTESKQPWSFKRL